MIKSIILFLSLFIAIASSTDPLGTAGDECSETLKCAGDLVCEESVCKIPRLGLCKPRKALCANGLPCIGAKTTKKCKEYRRPGEPCLRDPFWLCDPSESFCGPSKECVISLGSSCEGFEDSCARPGICSEGICKIPEGGRCSGGLQDFCAPSLVCNGRGRRRFCTSPLEPGAKCGPKDVCQDFSECIEKRCKITERGVCTDFPKQCAPGLDCVGLGEVKKCKPLKLPGQICEQDPFWVCEERSTCVEERCKLNEGEDCVGFEDKCIDGTVCEVVKAKTICNPVLEEGDACKKSGKGGNCGPGLSCKRKKCTLDSTGPKEPTVPTVPTPDPEY